MISTQRYPVILKALACLTAGAVTTLAFAPYNFSWIVFLTFFVLLFSWRDSSPKQTWWFGWLFGLGLQSTGVSWLYYSIHFHGGGSILSAFIAIFLLAAFLSTYTATAGYIVSRWCKNSAALKLMILYPIAFILSEWLQGILLTGFGWMQIGYSQIDLPLSGYAPVFGNSALTLFVLMTAGAFVYAFDKKCVKTIPLKTVSIIVVVIWGMGFVLKQVEWTQVDGNDIKVSLIQANIAQKQKWKQSNRVPTLELYHDLTAKHLDSDIVVWPETAVPDYKHRVRGYMHSLRQLTENSNTDLLLGLFIKNQQTGRYYNSVVDLNGSAYRKRHLVPLGEYVPLRFLMDYFNQWVKIPMSDIALGDVNQPLMEAAGYPISVSICFEDAFARDIRLDLPKARFLVNVSNDAWFEDSIEPHQHHAIARMRALETGRYMLRATNTGITSIIGPQGEELAVAPQFETTVLTGKIKPMKGSTPYVIWGDWMILGLCLLALGLVIRQNQPDVL